jgi:hypothetical protein
MSYLDHLIFQFFIMNSGIYYKKINECRILKLKSKKQTLSAFYLLVNSGIYYKKIEKCNILKIAIYLIKPTINNLQLL